LAVFAGKYAAFVWPAYGVCVAVFAWMIADTLGRARHWRAEVRRLDDRGEP
jgi:heme exporter protein D